MSTFITGGKQRTPRQGNQTRQPEEEKTGIKEEEGKGRGFSGWGRGFSGGGVASR